MNLGKKSKGVFADFFQLRSHVSQPVTVRYAKGSGTEGDEEISLFYMHSFLQHFYNNTEILKCFFVGI